MTPLKQAHSRPVACPEEATFARTLLARSCGLVGAGLFTAGFCLAAHTALAQIATPLVPLTGYAWRYNDTATDLGTAWRATSYALETSWPLGMGLFGVEGSIPYPYPAPIKTPMVLDAGRTTYYLRTHFNFGGTPSSVVLQAVAFIDDGAVFYMNGVEMGRVRLPTGTITFNTKAQLAYPEGVPVQLEFSTTNLVVGDNVLAVEVHQNSDTSSDVVFGLSLTAYALVAPTLTNLLEPADRLIKEGDGTTLDVFATGYPPPDYQWYKDGHALTGAVGASLVIPTVTAPDEGAYYAVASNRAGSVTSRVATVRFLADKVPPRVLYALGLPSLTEVRVGFSKPVDPLYASDYLNWTMEIAGGGAPLDLIGGSMVDSSTLILTSLQTRDPALSYELTTTVDIPDVRGNVIPAGSVFPLASFQGLLVSDGPQQLWSYNDTGTDLGASWVLPAYDDSAWRRGPGAFDGYRLGAQVCRSELLATLLPVGTCLSLSNAAGTAQLPTVYLRTHFTVPGNPTNAALQLETIVNDGAVFYLNGTEFFRVGMPDGPPAYSTLASRSIGDASTEFFFAPASGMIPGDNVLSVELHQASLTSPDLTLYLRMIGIFTSEDAIVPHLTYQLHNGSLQLNWSPSSAMLQSADSLAGPWSPVTPSNPPAQHVTGFGGTQKLYRVLLQ